MATKPTYEELEQRVKELEKKSSERRRLEEALEFEREQLLAIFESVNEIIYVADPNTHEILYANKTLRNSFQKDLVGGICYKEFQELDSPCEFCTNEIILKEKETPYRWEYHNPVLQRDYIITNRIIKWPDGRDVRFELAMDISERKHLEDQLRQSQKMEAVGTLAGGVAHDFNNILTAIQGNADIALMTIQEDDPLHKYLDEVRKNTIRAASLTRQLLLFSRKQAIDMAPLSLNNLIQGLAKMLQRLIGEDIFLHLNLMPETWAIDGDAGTIEQIFMNLIVNARDAMPEGGEIIITTRNVHIDDEYCKTHTHARPGKFVHLSVRDKGMGMDQALIDRIFEPFFTTKEARKGTGLGLSVVYGIVKQHKGWIDVESIPGNGAVFNIHLPAIAKWAEEKDEATVSLKTLIGRGERLLVLEDDKLLRETSCHALSKNGYTVFAAGDVRETLDLFQKEGGQFDLVFCDVVLPDGTGIKLVEELLKLRPGIGVLFTSGYVDEKSGWSAIKEAGYPYLQKPYSLSDLLRAVKDSLTKK